MISLLPQVRGLTDNHNINYRPECEKDRSDMADIKSSVTKTQFDRDLDRERDRDLDRDRELDRDRDSRDRRSTISGSGGGIVGSGVGDEQSILDLKDFKERERDRELSTTPVDHTSSKRRRKNSSSNCDNSLTSTHSANVQERNYSQDSQVSRKVKTRLFAPYPSCPSVHRKSQSSFI